MRCAALFALLGMTLNALWPLLANAEPRTDYFSAEICSSSKAPGLAVGKLPMQLPAPKSPHLHCVFCASGASNASLIGTVAAVVTPITASPAVAVAAEPRRHGSRAFLLAESRAPPVSPSL